MDYLLEYKSSGIVIIRGIVDNNVSDKLVSDIWENIINLPWKDQYRSEWQNINDSMKDNYWRKVSIIESKKAKSIYPSMGGFGALNPPPFYHTKGQWEVRQNLQIVNIFQKLLGKEDLMVTLDRISFKYPGMGETEFLHWDSNPWTWPDEFEHIQGMLALSDTSFYAVPESHTIDFREKFIKQYPKSKRPDQYFVTKKHDPMKLQEKIKEYKLQRGDLVIWSNRLLHEARKNKQKTIRYAYYISYFPSESLHPTVINQYKKLKLDYLTDRIESYKTGRNPMFYPSGTKIDLYSKQHYMYYPDILNDFCNRFNPEISEERIYQSGKKKGQKVRVPINYAPSNYTAPKLSALGRKLLRIS